MRLSLYPGTSSITLYKDGTLVATGNKRIRLENYEAKLKDLNKELQYTKRLLSTAGVNVDNIHTIEDLNKYKEENPGWYDDNQAVWEAEDQIAIEILEDLGLDTSVIDGQKLIEDVAIDYARNGDVETASKIFEKIVNLNGDYFKYGIKKIIVSALDESLDLDSKMVSLREIVLKDGVKSTPYLPDLTSLQKIEIPSSVVMISGFQGCPNLKKYEIPAGAKKVFDGLFVGSTANTEIIFNNTEAEVDALWGTSWKSQCGAKITYKK